MSRGRKPRVPTTHIREVHVLINGVEVPLDELKNVGFHGNPTFDRIFLAARQRLQRMVMQDAQDDSDI